MDFLVKLFGGYTKSEYNSLRDEKADIQFEKSQLFDKYTDGLHTISTLQTALQKEEAKLSQASQYLRFTYNSTSYACAIYTTTDECPEPNLKLKLADGTNGYVKLGSINDAHATPMRVKTTGGTIYTVLSKVIDGGGIL